MDYAGDFGNLRGRKVWGRHFGDGNFVSRGWHDSEKSRHLENKVSLVVGFDFLRNVIDM